MSRAGNDNDGPPTAVRVPDDARGRSRDPNKPDSCKLKTMVVDGRWFTIVHDELRQRRLHKEATTLGYDRTMRPPPPELETCSPGR